MQQELTQVEVHNVHALIETKLKGREIYLPIDYKTVTQESRLSKPLRSKLYNHQNFHNHDDDHLLPIVQYVLEKLLVTTVSKICGCCTTA